MSQIVETRDRRSTRFRSFNRFLSRNYLNVVSACLLALACFFFVQVQQQRYATLSDYPERFSDGDLVTISRVIDGDEIRIKKTAGSTRVRILGIKSFDSTERDFMLLEYGNVAVDFLTETALNKEVQIKVAEKQVDDEGRLLATILMGENKNEDLAEAMIANGVTLVYTKYPFPNMDQYLESQKKAKAEKQGLWQNQRVSARAESMLQLWSAERNDR